MEKGKKGGAKGKADRLSLRPREGGMKKNRCSIPRSLQEKEKDDM